MSNAYVFPQNQNTFVPALSQGLMVDFALNVSKFPINEIIDYWQVEKEIGYYVKYQGDNTGRVVNAQDNLWQDGSDRVKNMPYGTDAFSFFPYQTTRRAENKMLGYLAVQQAGWPLLETETSHLATQLMTARVYRLYQTLCTTGNWSGNTATAATAGGGTWSASTSASLNYIRNSLAYAINKIKLATNGVVMAGDLMLVINPNMAKVMTTSGEYSDWVKQQVTSTAIWEASEQYLQYGLPAMTFGLRTIVDGTVYNSADVGASASYNFCLPDGYALIISKPKQLSSFGGNFSTVQPAAFEQMSVEVFNSVKNRRYEISCVENLDTSSNCIVAPQSGYLLTSIN